MKRYYRSGSAFLYAFLLLAVLLPASGQPGQTSWEKRLDWQEAVLILDLRQSLAGEPVQPDTRYQAEMRLASFLPAFFLEAVMEIPLDSFQTIRERIKEREEDFHRLNDLAGGGLKEYGALSPDMSRVEVRYRFPFHGEQGLITPFITHSRPQPIRKVIGFEPTRAFTGLVIFAQGEFPVHGRQDKARIRPALLPRLWDADMKAILEPEMCEPETLRRWGMAAYTFSPDEKPFLERIGPLPLYTMARGVYGKNFTDPILPLEVSRKLLSLEENRRLLREGRILIILDAESARGE